MNSTTFCNNAKIIILIAVFIKPIYIMKPACFSNTTELASSAKLHAIKYQFIKHVRVAFDEPLAVYYSFKIKTLL